jgi:cytochrome c-type biogenesis protein CcmE
MNKRYIIGIAVAIVFVVIALLSFDQSTIEYANFSDAKASGKKVQIIGQWVKEQPAVYNADKDEFTFTMQDKKNEKVKIVFAGSKPNNFDIAHYFVVKGKFSGNDFKASEIYTKCPSKYEGNANELKKQ